MKVIVVHPGGLIETRIIKDGKDTLKDMQNLVGGYVENVHPAHVKLPEQFMMVVNEEGHIHNLPINPIASRIYGGAIAGTAVFIREDKINNLGERDWVDCTQKQLDRLKRLIESVSAISGVTIIQRSERY